MRQSLKKTLPAPLRRGLLRLRDVLNGPGIEADVLHESRFEPDPGPRPRFTMIVTDLSAATAFGGVMTGLSLAAGLRQRLEAEGIDFRLVSEKPVDPSDSVLSRVPGLDGLTPVSLFNERRRLKLRAREMCLVYNWWLSANLDPALDAQAAHFARPRMPKIHLIQEYEPHFYPFSAAHLVAHGAMSGDPGLWAVMNTRELHAFWSRQGHVAERTWVFEPRLNGALRPYVDGITAADKRRTLFVYGRPRIERNAFFLIRRGLEAWARTYGAAHPDWRIVSAGTPHPDLPLGNGHSLTSLGKLSLDAYAGLLRETAVGLSLMVSPHPSYPPLEMAHFGVRVLTNRYTDKEPKARHENLLALDGVGPQEIARAVEAAITGFEADPDLGLRAQSRMPDFLGPEEIDCLPDLAKAIVERLA
jgi:O-antigen biosynthesis protein